jgi:hypothetical protein
MSRVTSWLECQTAVLRAIRDRSHVVEFLGLRWGDEYGSLRRRSNPRLEGNRGSFEGLPSHGDALGGRAGLAGAPC